mgnify:CR=1 FL=1
MNETEAKIARANAMLQWAESEGGLFELFAALERKYFDEWRDTDLDDTAAREAAWNRNQALRDLRTVCEAVIRDGRDAIAIAGKREEKQNV